MDWVPWANAIRQLDPAPREGQENQPKKSGTDIEKMVNVHPGLNRFKFFKETPEYGDRFYHTSNTVDTPAETYPEAHPDSK